MGFRASVRVCYGIDYGPVENGGDAGRFDYGDTDPEKGDTSPAGLVYWSTPADCPVEAVVYGHYDYRRIVLAANHLTLTGRAFQPLDLSELTLEPNIGTADAAIRAYCERYGLAYSQPRWLAVPYYG